MSSRGKAITVQGANVTISRVGGEDYISLTDIAKYHDSESPSTVISLWMRTHSTIEYLGLWETLHNLGFKPHIYEGFKTDSARAHFWMSAQKWIKGVNAAGIISKSGRYGGGTFAHPDIAFKFAAWISAEFELYLIKEFQRLKTEEQKRLSAEWDLQRTLAKVNYRIHTDAIKTHIIPSEVTKAQANLVYANEADLLNVALFGITAAEWRESNPGAGKKANIRDGATLEQLIVLSNLESINALLIEQGLSQSDRLIQLNKTAITQMKSLIDSSHIRRLAASDESLVGAKATRR